MGLLAQQILLAKFPWDLKESGLSQSFPISLKRNWKTCILFENKEKTNKQTNNKKKTRVKFCSLLPVIYTDIHVAIFMKVLIWLNSQFQDCFDCSSWLITPIGKMSSGLAGLLILKKPCSLPLWITFQLKPVSDFAFKEPDVRHQLFLLVLKVNPYPTHRYPQSS